MANCVDSNSGEQQIFGAYCFKLTFTPVSVIANAIAHPDDGGELYLYTAGPNVTGTLTKTNFGRELVCPAGFQDAAVYGRRGAGDGIMLPFGGFFVVFFD
jgi:hypothetical protein